MAKERRTIQEVVDGAYCPLPIKVIPNNMGINLCSVAAVEWEKQEDGQLVSLSIEFIPAPVAEVVVEP